jgi:stress-induced-phosphoprotein 1
MSEFRTPETKALLSDVEKKIKEEERKAYIDPVKAEEEKEKGNELFKNGLLHGCTYLLHPQLH